MHTQGSAQHQDHTLHHHFTLLNKRRLNVTLANISGQSYWVWSFIQQTFIITEESVPGSSQKDMSFPLQALMNLWAKRISNHKIGRQQRQSSQPPREPRAGICNSEQWSQGKSHTRGPRRWAGVRLGGQSRRKMGSAKVQSERWQGGVREMLTRYLNERWRNSLKTWSRTKGTVFS